MGVIRNWRFGVLVSQSAFKGFAFMVGYPLAVKSSLFFIFARYPKAVSVCFAILEVLCIHDPWYIVLVNTP